MKIESIWVVVAAIGALTGAGWGAHEYVGSQFASKEEVVVAGGKADFVLDRQMESVIREIAEIERKPNPTRGELARLQHLRQIYDELRRVRTGK